MSITVSAKVVIVETLDDLIKSRDGNSGTDVRDAFDLLHTVVMKDFAPKVAVIGLHHLNKSEMASRSEGLTGSLQWRGRTDGVWYYGGVSDDDARRTFQADVRSRKALSENIRRLERRNPNRIGGSIGL